MLGEADCRHCGETIRYTTGRGWVHVERDTALCPGPAKHIAEPKRAKRAPRG